PWIAVVAAYALALQLLLTGFAAAQMTAPGDGSAGALFAICHSGGDGLAADQGGTDKPAQPQFPCVLCTLTSAAAAILPDAHLLSIVDVKSLSAGVPHYDAGLLPYDSPTGQYQRGPPASIRISG